MVESMTKQKAFAHGLAQRITKFALNHAAQKQKEADKMADIKKKDAISKQIREDLRVKREEELDAEK